MAACSSVCSNRFDWLNRALPTPDAEPHAAGGHFSQPVCGDPEQSRAHAAPPWGQAAPLDQVPAGAPAVCCMQALACQAAAHGVRASLQHGSISYDTVHAIQHARPLVVAQELLARCHYTLQHSQSRLLSMYCCDRGRCCSCSCSCSCGCHCFYSRVAIPHTR